MRKLKIENFKCFIHKEINFANLTVLAGGNGAGKSTIIQTLLVLLQTYNAKNFNYLPSKLYLNDYYCELGNSQRLLNYEAPDDKIKFTIYDKNNMYSYFECNENKKDMSILEVTDSNMNPKTKHNNSLNFLKYFDFIGADRFGPKTFHHTDSNFGVINVGKFGEYTALVLNNYKFESLENVEGDLLKNVNDWLSYIFGYTQVDTKYINEANIAMLKIKNKITGDYESPVNMPYGVSYLLPIIVSCLVRQIPKNKLFENYVPEVDENELIIIENPEAHLHPSAQSKLGYFLAKMSRYVQIIIETHSEHIINGIRLATLEDDVDQEEIIINFLESNEESIEPNIEMIKIDKFSDLTDWPDGFFDQQEVDIRELIKAKRKKNDSKPSPKK